MKWAKAPYKTTRSHDPSFLDERDSPFPQRRLRSAGKAKGLGAIPIALADSCRLWRRLASGNGEFVVRIFAEVDFDRMCRSGRVGQTGPIQANQDIADGQSLDNGATQIAAAPGNQHDIGHRLIPPCGQNLLFDPKWTAILAPTADISRAPQPRTQARRCPISKRSWPSELDAIHREADNITMRRVLRLVLVIAAIFGLFGQTVAVAASPATVTVQATAPAMVPMDCLEMMQGASGKSLPCERMTLGCIAGMGCSIPVMLDVGSPFLVRAMVETAAPAWSVTPALKGRSLHPEPHPPNALA